MDTIANISTPLNVQSAEVTESPRPKLEATLGGKNWGIQFDEPDLTSDAGLAALPTASEIIAILNHIPRR